MAAFTLKAHDTRPVLEVALLNPDGTANDLTGSTGWELHISKHDGTVLTRTMVKEGADTDGVLRYTWVSTDWDAGELPIPDAFEAYDLRMEYEVTGGTSRMTFPNGSYDTLHILSDVA